MSDLKGLSLYIHVYGKNNCAAVKKISGCFWLPFQRPTKPLYEMLRLPMELKSFFAENDVGIHSLLLAHIRSDIKTRCINQLVLNGKMAMQEC